MGIPQLAQHTRVGRVFVVVQGHLSSPQCRAFLKAKLAATWRLAKVAEWTYELDKQVIVFHGDQKAFLGFEKSHHPASPMTSLWARFGKRIARKYGEPSPAHSATEVTGKSFMRSSFTKVRGSCCIPGGCRSAARMGRLVRGLSLDISRVRDVHERKARKEQMHVTRASPERDMAYDRLYYLAVRAVRLALPFSIIGVRGCEVPRVKAADGKRRPLPANA